MSALVLGVETATAHSSVCLVDGGGVRACAELGQAQRHGEFTAAAIARCLELAGCTPGDVTAVVAGLGPGRYTGMRVGIATAQAFAHARGIGVVGACTLDVLAQAVRHAVRPVWSAIDARRGEVFWAAYAADEAPGLLRRVTEPRVGRPDELAQALSAGTTDGRPLVVGDGALAHADLLAATGAEVGSWATATPRATALVELAWPRVEAEDLQAPAELLPIYLRQADAKIGWRTRGALHGGGSTAGGGGP